MYYNSQRNITKQLDNAQKIRDASTPFWKEADMQHRCGFEGVGRLLGAL